MKTLPLGQPAIASFLFHAYPLSILAQEDRYLPWFYSTHIQLFSFPDEELKFFTHPFSTRHEVRHLYFQTCPLLDVQSIDREILTASPTEFIRWIKNRIEHGYYVQVDVDFYDLPNRPHYQRCHFIHEILISGFDDVQQVFYASGYDERGNYATAPLSYVIAQKALAWSIGTYLQQITDCGQQVPPWFDVAMEDRPRVFLYKYLRGHTTVLDIASITEQIHDYLCGNNTAERYRALARPRTGGVWGTNVYNMLREQIRSGERTEFNPTIWRILWEHKRCMLGLLCLLEERHIASRPLSEQWTKLVHQVNELRLVLLRSHRQPRPPSADKRLALIDAIAIKEREYLSKLKEQL